MVEPNIIFFYLREDPRIGLFRTRLPFKTIQEFCLLKNSEV